jgi:CheY-like chemotaxis protein
MKLSEATVLVVDDEPELREIFAAWLGRGSCKVLTAANGADALTILAKEKIDVLVSDIRMPVLDGVGLVRRVREMGLEIPSIIFVSGFGDVDRREMYDLGVEAMLEKPLRRRDLLGALEQSLMAREELWLTPAVEPMECSVSITIDTRKDAMGGDGFELGRGGCSFSYDRRLEEGKTIDLSIEFPETDRSLRAQGEVRWYHADYELAGVAFRYLDPQCRGWVLERMMTTMARAFIPEGTCHGSGGASRTSTAAPWSGVEASHDGRGLDAEVAEGADELAVGGGGGR